jgi:hypothetical protein
MRTEHDSDASTQASSEVPSVPRWAFELSAVGADVARSILSGQFFFPRTLFLNGVGLAAASTQGLGALMPESMNRTAWLEVANKLSAYRMFASADRLMDPSDRAVALRSALPLVQGLNSYSAVWAMEGVGYYYALAGGQLTATDVCELPRYTRIPLHTGAGLALAESALRSMAQRAAGHMLGDFWKCCRTAAIAGYEEVLFEALGLVAATLYPSLVAELSNCLTMISEEQSDLFWHGIGRGLYFSPAAFMPLAEARNRAYKQSQCWPATDNGRRNALAGLAWAMTLVNIRDPEVVYCWLRDHADECRKNDAVRNGMTSALVVWLSADPEDRYVDALARFQPADNDPRFAELWDVTVRRACRDARQLVTSLSSDDLAAQVFRVRPLPTEFNVGRV